MDRDMMINNFIKNLKEVEKLVILEKKQLALKKADELLSPLNQIADRELWNLVPSLFHFIELDNSKQALITINAIKEKFHIKEHQLA